MCLSREPFTALASRVLKLAEKRRINCFISASMATDIYYITNRHIKNKAQSREILKMILKLVSVLDVTANDVYTAINSTMPDFEDAIIAQCAERHGINYIITRDTKDFADSRVPAITPSDFMQKHFS